MNESVSSLFCVLKKTAIVFSFFVFTLAALNCGKSVDRAAQLDDFAAELEKLTAEMTQKLDANPNLKGIGEAQSLLDARKEAIKKQFDEFKNMPEIIFPAEARKRFDERTSHSFDSFQKAIERNLVSFAREPAAKEKLERLIDDYTGMFEK